MPSASLLLQAAASGALTGAIYGLVALAMALTFGVMRVLNFAHGDMLMVAMYGVVLLNQAFGLHPYAAAVLLVPVLAALGWAVFVLLIRPTLNAGVLMQAQLTLGLSFVIQSLALMTFGADLFNVQTAISGSAIRFGGVVIGMPLVAGSLVSVVASGLLSLLLMTTETGFRIRAVAQDPVMAALCGVRVERVRMAVFVGSAALLAIAAGCLMTFYYVTPSVGMQFSVLSLMISVLGGLGDLRGAFLSGLLIGVAEALAGTIIASTAAQAAVYVLFGLGLLLRPRGLLGGGSAA